MGEENREGLADELIERLRSEGIPEGTWLIDIELARKALRQADEVLRKLQQAIIRAAGPDQPR